MMQQPLYFRSTPWGLSAALPLLLVLGCERSASHSELGDAAGQKTAETAAEAATEPAANGLPAQGAASLQAVPGEPRAAYFTQLTVVRRAPSEARDVDDGTGRKRRLVNVLTSVYRGEQATVLKAQGDWLQVRLSDAMHGWVKGNTVVMEAAGKKIEMATVFEVTKTFTRPDLLALSAGRLLEPGSLLFVLRQIDQFSEVNTAGTAQAWVLTDLLSQDTQEVQAAKLLGRAKALADRHDANSAVPLELAKAHYATTRLVQALLFPKQAVDPNQAGNGNTAAAQAPAAPYDRNAASYVPHDLEGQGHPSLVPPAVQMTAPNPANIVPPPQ
jgi:hypothetical protein